MKHKIDIANDFSPSPFGRKPEDGPNSGVRFRTEVLVPALKKYDQVEVELDGVRRGMSSSFISEAFGGLARGEFTYQELKKKLIIVTTRKDYEIEIWSYIEDEDKIRRGI